MRSLQEAIFSIRDQEDFNRLALEVFQYQVAVEGVYSEYVKRLGIDPASVKKITDVPFLPIGFFKSRPVYASGNKPETTFLSSSTTGSKPSRHTIADLSLYRRSFLACFKQFYGPANEHTILALLPSYLERGSSSLVYMVKELIRESGKPESGFYLYNLDELTNQLHDLEARGRKTILLGVSFALLDLAKAKRMNLKHTIVMETGGMKGRREEITRMELHEVLMDRLGVPEIHSEYGMTELLSQAYSKKEGRFLTPPWMGISIRDQYDPFRRMDPGLTGGLNIIDLANLYSCAFIETEDLGRLHADGTFEVLGRFDRSEVRGCNLMAGDA
jgi:hypothetical protein